MTTIANALSELGVTEWVLRGEPTTEAEFNQMFRKVTGAMPMAQQSKAAILMIGVQRGQRYQPKRLNWSTLNLCACYAKNVIAALPKQIGGRDQITQ